MNVKKNSSLSICNLAAVKSKNKTGQDIRRRLKINSVVEASQVSQPQDKENSMSNNTKIAKDLKDIQQKKGASCFMDTMRLKNRVPMMKRSIEINERMDSCKSTKSVRFSEKISEPACLSRKHSANSILKNNSVMKRSTMSMKASLTNSMCSNIANENQSCQNQSVNRILRQKYERIQESIKKCNSKYKDELFPPIWSSVSRMNADSVKKIQWKRISDLFKPNQVCIWDTNYKITIQGGKLSKKNVVPTCFNSLKHNSFLLDKIFQNQKFSELGIYCVKIFQNNVWKYMIIDDLIPVVDDCPAFLEVKSQSKCKIQIWPYLLQKAYAKYYGNYQGLENGNQIDFIAQLSGSPVQEIMVCPENIQMLEQNLFNIDSIVLGRKKHHPTVDPIIPAKQLFIFEDSTKCYMSFSLFTSTQIMSEFETIYFIFPHQYLYNVSNNIKFYGKAQSQHISLRVLKLEEPTNCMICLSQKDMKHYSSVYKYCWMRIIIILKEGEKCYRWIHGDYKNTKNINCKLNLSPGEYFIVLAPEWEGKGLDYSVTFYANSPCSFDRIPYKGNQFVVTEAAMDLSQRKGVLKQINKNICTYSYIERTTGLIIQNINNERAMGHVRILRSIEGLCRPGTKQLIRTFNKQFKQDLSIEVKIESLDHFTVVLAVKGGIDQNFLNKFDFGN